MLKVYNKGPKTSHVSLVMWCFITSITRLDFTRGGQWVFKPHPPRGQALLGILTVVFVLCARAVLFNGQQCCWANVEG